MDVKRISGGTITDKEGNTIESVIEDTFVLIESEPNSDGLYEVPRSVHFSYPALVAQSLLAEAGYIYVGHKKGNYDIELWTKRADIFIPPDTTMAVKSNTVFDVVPGNALALKLMDIRRTLVDLVAEVDLMAQGLK